MQGSSGPYRLYETLVTGDIWQDEQDDTTCKVVRKRQLQLWLVLLRHICCGEYGHLPQPPRDRGDGKLGPV